MHTNRMLMVTMLLTCHRKEDHLLAYLMAASLPVILAGVSVQQETAVVTSTKIGKRVILGSDESSTLELSILLSFVLDLLAHSISVIRIIINVGDHVEVPDGRKCAV